MEPSRELPTAIAAFPPPPPPAAGSGTRRTPVTGSADALVVRQNLARRVVLSLREIGSARRRSLISISVFSLAQIAAFIVVLALTRNSDCDRPLQTCLILTCVRLALSFPLNAYSSLVPSTSRHLSQERRNELESERRFGSPVLDRRVRQLSDVALGLSFCVFLLLNIYVISSETCRHTAPALFWTAVVALVFSYLFAAEVILLLLAIIFFLPLALIGIRWFGWGAGANEIGPLKTAEIGKIPLCIFIGIKEDRPASPTAPLDDGVDLATIPRPTPPTQRHPFWRSWKPRKKIHTHHATSVNPATSSASGQTRALPTGVEGIRLTESQASCAICICDYEPPPPADEPWEPETLRLLPCGHVFHHQCIDSWLATSGRCPICQQPVLPAKGKRGRAQEAV